MVFTSVLFLCMFLPAVLVVYHAVPERFRNAVALTASLAFYAWGAPRFVVVLVVSSLVTTSGATRCRHVAARGPVGFCSSPGSV